MERAQDRHGRTRLGVVAQRRANGDAEREEEDSDADAQSPADEACASPATSTVEALVGAAHGA
jgi:hypothetical protein